MAYHKRDDWRFAAQASTAWTTIFRKSNLCSVSLGELMHDTKRQFWSRGNGWSEWGQCCSVDIHRTSNLQHPSIQHPCYIQPCDLSLQIMNILVSEPGTLTSWYVLGPKVFKIVQNSPEATFSQEEASNRSNGSSEQFSVSGSQFSCRFLISREVWGSQAQLIFKHFPKNHDVRTWWRSETGRQSAWTVERKAQSCDKSGTVPKGSFQDRRYQIPQWWNFVQSCLELEDFHRAPWILQNTTLLLRWFPMG